MTAFGGRLLMAGAVAFLALALATAPASAHAVLLSASPGDGVVLERAPPEIVLHFNEPVTPVQVRVISQTTGKPVTAEEDVRAVDQDIRVKLPADIANGGYVVSYRVISVDSHPVAGAIPFGVGATPAAAEAPADADEGFWRSAALILRVLHDLGTLSSAGGVFFLIAVGPPKTSERSVRRFLIAVAAVTAVATLIEIGAEGGRMAGVAAAAVADPAIWRLAWSATFGTSALLTFIGLALIGAGLALPFARSGLAVAGVGGLAAIGGFAVTGHAATAEPVALTAPAMVLHTAAISYWIGSLWPLGLVLAHEKADISMPVVARFARIAVAAVALLAVAGIILAAVQMQSFGALVDTGYGRILMLKLAIVAILLLVAWDNRRRLTPALAGGERWAGPALRHAIGIEIALAAGILLATGLLGQVLPPRAADQMAEMMDMDVVEVAPPAAGSAGFSTTVTVGMRTAQIALSPAKAGHNYLGVHLADADGKAIDAKELTVDIADPGAGIEAIRRTPTRIYAGDYSLDGTEFSLAGKWTVTVHALIDDFTTVEFETEIPVQ